MSLRGSLLIVGCCLCIFTVVVIVFAMNFRSIKANVAALESSAELTLDGLGHQVRRPEVRAVPVAKQDLIKTIHRLRESLSQQTELHRKQKSDLIRQITEHDRLQSEYARLMSDHQALRKQYSQLWREADSALMLLDELSRQTDASAPEPVKAAEPDADVAEPISENPAQVPASDNDQGELELVRLELSSQQQELRQALDQIRDLEDDNQLRDWELQQAQTQIRELKEVSDQHSRLTNMASVTLVKIGPAAVPFLIELSTDQEPAPIRIWSVSVLAAMGPEVEEAQDRLKELLDDQNAEVAKAAQDALNSHRDN